MNNYLKVLGFLTVFLSVSGQAAFLPLCQRTEQVKKELEVLTKKKCVDITEVDLLAIKRVDVGFNRIQAFKKDDFSGLKNLEILNIRSNPYTELPEGLFDDLGNLKTIVIISNTALRHFPDDFLEKTPLLEHLHVFHLPLRTLSESVLTRLANLKNIQEIDVDRELFAAERERLRRIFPENGKVQLNFN